MWICISARGLVTLLVALSSVRASQDFLRDASSPHVATPTIDRKDCFGMTAVYTTDHNNETVCACTGETTVCISGSEKCSTAHRIDVANEDLRHSTISRQPWPLIVRQNSSSLWPFPGKIQGFRPFCEGCKCVSTCKKIVFIVGCGHSGTTYATRILGAHPRYHAILAETGWFSTYGGSRVAFESFRKEAVSCARAGKTTLVEKTPKHVRYLSEILRVFPEARIIFVVRDGRDVALSLAKRYQYSMNSKVSICLAGMRWTLDNLAAQHYLNASNVHVMRYEDLVANPHGTADELFQFLEHTDAPSEVHHEFGTLGELRWGRIPPVSAKPKEGMTQRTKRGRVVAINKHLRNWQVNQPLYDGRGQWTKNFTNQQLTWLYNCVNFKKQMFKFGYLDQQNKSQWFAKSGETLPKPWMH